MSGAEPKLDLDRIVFIGRTFDEYMRMFDLRQEELTGRRILDCPAGACSFIAKANPLGADATAADIAYFHSPEILAQKGLQDIEHAMYQLDKVQDNFVWEYFKSIDGLRKIRIEALTDSIQDRRSASERYIPAVLPELPFRDQEFDLTLSAHFLFMYGDRLDYDFHMQTLKELMRVTKEEIRIFPLVDLSSQRYEHLDPLIEHIVSQGWTVEEIEVPYEFQKGANHMLRIRRMNSHT
ncbi:methyltransferase domain-containing protein [Paenibacillus wynnii]|uniref:SAM-dependent methyltransferase n=1 Tax=Paenibacillus wynnii TaxID=268407 RepID=A0A098M2I6_9BACL|nr:methyltransferase domain-containing protein [Paenibacillus wynnii]KGE16574.1 SAM-dependent methyltransferase [Paenibacillus wynnii]